MAIRPTYIPGMFGGPTPPDVRASRDMGVLRHPFGAGGSIGQDAPYVRQIYPPWVYKLPSSTDFNANGFREIIGAGAGTTLAPASVRFTLPANMVGYLQIAGIYVLTPLATTDLTFTFRINQGPVAGYDNIIPPPGVANFVVQNFSELQVRVPMGGTVDLLITNNSAAGPWTVGGKVAGWYHPQVDEERLYGSL